MNVLIACEESQVVCSAFRLLGHHAYSCDVLDCSGGHPEWHIKTDVRSILNPIPHFSSAGIAFYTTDGVYHFIPGKWDLIIAHPPCTYFSRAGANWLYRGGVLNHDRYVKGLEMKELFMEIYHADCDKIAIENPVPLKIFELPAFSQQIQPYQFGDPFTKCTRLWLKGLPFLVPTDVVPPVSKWISCGNKNRLLQNNAICKKHGNLRSKTFKGIASAMALQWGGLCE